MKKLLTSILAIFVFALFTSLASAEPYQDLDPAAPPSDSEMPAVASVNTAPETAVSGSTDTAQPVVKKMDETKKETPKKKSKKKKSKKKKAKKTGTAQGAYGKKAKKTLPQ